MQHPLSLLDRFQRWRRSFRFPAPRQLLRFTAALTTRERVILAMGIIAIIGGLALASAGRYLATTEPLPAIGGTYVEGIIGEPHLVNPLFAVSNDVDADLSRLLYAGLFRVTVDGAITPDLAERFTWSADQRSLTVTINRNARWHDGAELTADDVLFTVHLIQDPNVTTAVRAAFRGVTVERADDRTVTFTTERPFPGLLSALTIGVLPQHLWTDIPPTHLALADLNLRPVGAGPYRFVGLTKDRRGGIRSYTLERYAGYHRTPPLLERITFRFVPDHDQLLDAFNSREVDGFGAVTPIPSAAITRRDVARITTRFPSSIALFFNPRRNPIFRDAAIREALDRTVDRIGIVTDVLGGAGVPIGGPIIPGTTAADPPPPTTFDRITATTILDRAKWQSTSSEAFRSARIGTEIQKLEAEKRRATPPTRTTGRARTPAPTITPEERAAIEERVRGELAECSGCSPQPYFRLHGNDALVATIVTPDLPELIAIATRIRDHWRSIGVRANVETVSLERIRSEIIPNRAYDVLLFSQVLGPDPDPFPFWHSSQVRHPGLNLAAFVDKRVDRLLEEARTTTDHAARSQKHGAFQRLLSEERPALFIAAPTFTYVVATSVHGVRLDALTQPADRFATVTEWYTATQRTWKRRAS